MHLFQILVLFGILQTWYINVISTQYKLEENQLICHTNVIGTHDQEKKKNFRHLLYQVMSINYSAKIMNSHYQQ